MMAMNEVTLFDRFDDPEGTINLGHGGLEQTYIEKASKMFKEGVEQMMADTNAPQYLQYGAPLGSTPFREEVAKFLTQEYDSPVDANDIVQTAGASQGLFLLASIFFEAGDIVFIEETSYFIAIKVLKETKKMKLVPVAMDEEGMIPQDLERALRENSGGIPQVITDDKPYWAMLYTVPTFHNPTGRLMSPERCQQIVSIARQYNLLVVCDDVYNLLYFTPPDRDGKSPKRLFAYDDKKDPQYKGNVVSNGSFSKIFSPGVRLGWLEAPKSIVDTLYKNPVLLTGGAFNHTMSHVIVGVMRLGLMGKSIEEMRETLQMKRDALCDTLSRELPSSVIFERPKGGFYVWITLPHGLDARDVQEMCVKDHKVVCRTGNETSSEGRFTNCLRLSFSYYKEDRLVEAAKAIGTVVRKLLSKTDQ